MANFYKDVPELKFHLNNPMMKRICELKERNYEDKDKYDYAPQDFEDAMDSFDRILDVVGNLTENVIAPNAECIDQEGPHCANGRVEYAEGTKVNLKAMCQAGLSGMTMPRCFGGLNFPITPYTMAAEIVSAGDAAFGNIWSLQDCIETLYEFGTEDQHNRFIPRVCAGETMSMYYSANERLYAATAKSPLGPFVQVGKEPFLPEGSIDGTLFRDDNGNYYFFFVRFNNGNNIWVARMLDIFSKKHFNKLTF